MTSRLVGLQACCQRQINVRYISLSMAMQTVRNYLRKVEAKECFPVPGETERNEFLHIHTAIWLWKLQWNSLFPVPRGKAAIASTAEWLSITPARIANTSIPVSQGTVIRSQVQGALADLMALPYSWILYHNALFVVQIALLSIDENP